VVRISDKKEDIMKQLTITRYHGIGKVIDIRWKELISALVLAGYSVYADEEQIVFCIGEDDKIETLTK